MKMSSGGPVKLHTVTCNQCANYVIFNNIGWILPIYWFLMAKIGGSGELIAPY